MANTICLGTEIKLNIHVEPIGDAHMEDYDFTVNIYTSPTKSIEVTKKEAIHIDEDNYVVCLDTSKFGVGRLKCKITAYIPDGDFEDSFRTEIAVIDTGIDVVRNV